MFTTLLRRGLPLVLLLAASGQVLAQSTTDCSRPPGFSNTRQFLAGTQDVISYPNTVSRVAIGDPAVADVEMINSRTLLVSAVAPGVTTLMVWTSCSTEPDRLFLMVGDNLLGQATGGALTTAPQLMQVQTDIRVVEVSRTQLREAGNKLFIGSGSSPNALASPGVLDSILMGFGGGALTGLLSPGNGFSLAIGNTAGTIGAVINALETSGFAYTLAQTSLVALSGQTANFLAGGEFPVPMTVNGQTSIQFREFGVRLTLTATVISANQIILKVAPEVSELDYTSGVSINGVEVPGLRVRRTDTTISLAHGESFIISGLMTTQNRATVNRLPGLANIPIIGAFFRSSTQTLEERELIMIVTPRLVQPIAAGIDVPLPGAAYGEYRPTFYDFMLREDGTFVTPVATGRGGLTQ